MVIGQEYSTELGDVEENNAGDKTVSHDIVSRLSRCLLEKYSRP